MTFVALMRQECAFYDDDDHSSAALSARLTGDAANVQSVSICVSKRLFLKNLDGKFYFYQIFHLKQMSTPQVIGYPFSVILQSISTFVIGICISLVYSVKLTFVCLAAVPFSLLMVLVEAK